MGLVERLLQTTTARIIATCRTPTTATRLQDLQHLHAERLLLFPLDVTELAQHHALRDQLMQQGVTSIDILIANAGVNSVGLNGDPATKTPTEEMQRIFNTNVIGVMHTLQTFQDLVLASKTRLFVVISSIMGSIGNADKWQYGGSTAYRTSKSAVNMFSVCFANDSKIKDQRAKVICLHPGWVQTDMGGAGGRKADIEVDECTDGISHILNIASDLQTKTNQHTAVMSNYQEMHSILKEKSVVYVNYKGDILPW